MNMLYHGDNLDVLRQHVATQSVDLIYLDPRSIASISACPTYASAAPTKDRSGTGCSAEVSIDEDITGGQDRSETCAVP